MNMKKMRNAAVALTVGTGAIVAGTLGGFAVASAIPTPAPPSQADQSFRAVEEYPENAAGQTFGYVDQGTFADATERPDLVLVTTDDGVDGYAYIDELLPGWDAESPEELRAVAVSEPFEVAVYARDGYTLIGYQTVNRDVEE